MQKTGKRGHLFVGIRESRFVIRVRIFRLSSIPERDIDISVARVVGVIGGDPAPEWFGEFEPVAGVAIRELPLVSIQW